MLVAEAVLLPYDGIITALNGLHKVLFLTLSVTFLFVYEISWELLNEFVPNSQCLLPCSDKFEGQGCRHKKTDFQWISPEPLN